MGKQLNVAIIGLNLGQEHYKQYSSCPEANIVALCDIDKPWLDYYANKMGFAGKTYTDYKEMLKNPDIEAVSVCVPTGMHCQFVLDCLEAGKHVLCEKPFCLNVTEAQKMHDAAQKAGKQLMVSQNRRFEPDSQALKHLCEEKFFGDIYHVRVAWRRAQGGVPGPVETRENGLPHGRNWFNERNNGGGVLRDLGSHMIDLAMYLTDFPELESATAHCSRHFYPFGYDPAKYVCDSEDLATGFLKFKNGMSLQLEVSFASHIEEEVVFIELYGDKAGGSKRNDTLKLFQTRHGNNSVEITKKFNEPYIAPMKRFVWAVLNGEEVPVPSSQGIKIITILDAIYASGYGQ